MPTLINVPIPDVPKGLAKDQHNFMVRVKQLLETINGSRGVSIVQQSIERLKVVGARIQNAVIKNASIENLTFSGGGAIFSNSALTVAALSVDNTYEVVQTISINGKGGFVIVPFSVTLSAAHDPATPSTMSVRLCVDEYTNIIYEGSVTVDNSADVIVSNVGFATPDAGVKRYVLQVKKTGADAATAANRALSVIALGGSVE